MALTNPKIFGLKIGNKLTDVEDRRLVLRNLGIPEPDLDVIRGSVDAGGSRNDFINFSRLVQPIFRTLDRYYEDMKSYDSVVLDRASISSILFGNLTINGRLDASAMRYRYLDGTTVKIADISTSRVSAWSSADPKANDADLDVQAEARISYGAQVRIISSSNKSTLQFGSQVTNETGISGKSRLQTSQIPQEREFAAEVPTHKIKMNFDGTDTELYAMKGIPLIFEGNFRNTGGSRKSEIQVNTSGMSGIKPSWKVVEVDNPDAFFNFPNVLGNSNRSILNFKSGSSKDRFIKFYYRPDKIRTIYLRDLLIETLPVISLDILFLLNLENNDFKNMPDLNKFSPTLKSLNLRRNPLHNSENPLERKLNDNILNKIPVTLTGLTMGSTFYGAINDGTQTASVIFNRLPNLTSLNLQRYGGLQFFHKDTSDPECHIPNIPEDVTYYNIYRNDFRGIAGSDTIAKQDNSSQTFTHPTFGEKLVNDKGRSVSSIKSGGTGYSVGSGLQTTGGSAPDGGMTVRILEVSGTGAITKIELQTIAGNYLVGDELTVLQTGGSNGVIILGANDNGRSFLSAPTATGEKTIKTCEKLQTLLLSRNYDLTDEDFSIASPEIKTLRMTFTNLPIPDLSNRLKLVTFEANHSRNAGHIAYKNSGGAEIYKFDNCTALKNIFISNSASLSTGTGQSPNGGLHGAFPTTFTNPSLEVVRLENTRMIGGTPNDGGSGDTIPNTLFQGFGNNVRDIRFTSNSFRDDPGTVGNQVFNFTPNLQILRIRSNKKLTGPLPNIGACGKLRYLDLYNNKFTGGVYSLDSNESLGNVFLHVNQLTGVIPGYDNLPFLYRLRLNQNKFTGLNQLSLPRIIEFRAHINEITGTIPSFVNCPKIRFITLYSNNFTSYTPGAIAENYNLRLFDVSGCKLNQVALNTIVEDVYTNYQNSSGSRTVTVNLKNQDGQIVPSGEDVLAKIEFLSEKGWTILSNLPS